MKSGAEEGLRRWPAFAAREAVLRDLERAIESTPQALDTRFYYASFLRDHGRFDDALAAFEGVLAAAPDHVETLIAFGALLARCGRRLDARSAFERAVAGNGRHNAAAVNLANLLALDDPERAGLLYASVLERDAGFAPAHRGLCSLAAARGDAALAARHRAAGYADGPFGRRAYVGESMPHSVLALVSTDGGNIPLGAFLDERIFLVHEVYVEAYRGEPLPAHGLIVNAIADADRSAAALALAERFTSGSRVAVVNAPRLVAATGRIENAARLATLGDVIAPPARPFARNAPPPGDLPLVLRAPGLHMGRGMVRIDDARDVAAAVASFAATVQELIAIEYVETRSPDGAWRKYRVMAIDGRLYPLHLAVAERWDVHYFSAAMAARADYRAEEARFLADPRATLGSRAWQALERVRGALGLDFAGIDFALAAGGQIVVFEANAAMTPLRPDPGGRFAYRHAASAAVDAALTRLFAGRFPDV